MGIEEFQTAVSEWFDATTARGRLWYKRRMQRIGIVCGFALAIVINADTIGISNALWQNAILRESIVQAAQTSASQGQVIDGKKANERLQSLMDLGLPLGWSFAAQPEEFTESHRCSGSRGPSPPPIYARRLDRQNRWLTADGVCHLPGLADLVRFDKSPAQSALISLAARLGGKSSQRQKVRSAVSGNSPIYHFGFHVLIPPSRACPYLFWESRGSR